MPERSFGQIILEDRDLGSARTVKDVMEHIDDPNPHHKRYLEVYTKAQILIKERKLVRAKRLFGHLDRFAGFSRFEEENGNVLTAIDLLVNGQSNRLKIDP